MSRECPRTIGSIAPTSVGMRRAPRFFAQPGMGIAPMGVNCRISSIIETPVCGSRERSRNRSYVVSAQKNDFLGRLRHHMETRRLPPRRRLFCLTGFVGQNGDSSIRARRR